MKTEIVIAIAHAAFAPERRRTLDRLIAQISESNCRGVDLHVLRSETREHASVWAQRLWRHCAERVAATGARAAVCLNDDIEVCPNFVEVVRAQLDALDAWDAQHLWQRSSAIVSLHTVHPVAPSIAAAGQRWLRTYHVTGPAYLLRGDAAADAVRVFESMPRAYRERINEDNVAIYAAYRWRDPVWCSVPAVVAHDVSVPSTLGYENHPQRTASVPFAEAEHGTTAMMNPAFWRPEAEPPFVETPWMPTEVLRTTEVALILGIEPEKCWFCGAAPFAAGSEQTGARVCLACVRQLAAGAIEVAEKALASRAQTGKPAKLPAAAHGRPDT